MEGGGSSMDMGVKSKGKAKKTDRTRRTWSDVEDAALLENMKELVKDGWKGENGFRPGFMKKLEEKLLVQFPGTDLREYPHIKSRLTIWKRALGSLQTMIMHGTGVGFNTVTNMVECNNEAWDTVVKKDPSAIHMRFKLWPMYNDWCEVFGKDRATGETAEDVMQAVNEIIDDDVPFEYVGTAPDAPEEVDESTDNGPCDMDDNSQAPTAAEAPPNPRATSSRKRGSSQSDALVEVLDRFCISSEQRLDSMVQVMGYHRDLGQSRKELFQLMGSVPEISMDERIDAAAMLAQKSDLLEMFVGFPIDARPRFLRRMLAGAYGGV